MTSTKKSQRTKFEKPKFISKISISFDLISGPLFFLAFLLLLPPDKFSFAVKGAIGTLTWMTIWWIFRPVHIGVTSLLPILVNSIFDFVPMNEILNNYASPIVILLLGANIITVSWSASGLDKRLALRALCLIGPSIKQQLIVWFTVSVVLTILLPNTVVAAVLTPVAISMLDYSGLNKKVTNSKLATVILLAIAWGAGLGGFGSPLGGAMNLVSISYIEQLTGKEYMYLTWTIRMMPMLIVLSIIILVYLMSFKTEAKQLSGSKEYFVNEYNKMPQMRNSEKWSLVLFLCATLLAFARPLFQEIIPALKPPYIFLLFGILTFIVPGDEGKRLTTWEYTSPRLMWGLFYLFAGGMAIGKFIIISGTSDIIASTITNLSLTGSVLTIFIFVIIGILLCNISSSTAACAILIPIVINVILELDLNPIPYIYIASVASNCAFVLPTSVRAIPVGYGLDPKIMFRKGLFAVMMCIIVVTIMGYLFIKYWPGYSIA